MVSLIVAVTAIADAPLTFTQLNDSAITELSAGELIKLGLDAHARQDDDNAIKAMELALTKAEKFGTDYEHALEFLGWIYMERNDNANINRILGLMDEHNSHELSKDCDTPECHLERAEYHISKGNIGDAKEEFRAVFGMTLTDEEMATAYTHYARLLSSERDYAEAAEYYEMAADATVRFSGESEASVTLLRNAGSCHFIGGNYEKAISTHSRVINAVDRYGYSPNLKSASLLGLGNSYSAIKDYPSAIAAFKRWVKHLEDTVLTGEADYARAYARLASAEKFNRDYDSSISHYETAIRFYESLGMHDEAQNARDGLALCRAYASKEEGDDTEASAAAERQRKDKLNDIISSSLDMLDKGGDYLGTLFNAESLATIAGSYSLLEDYTAAVDYYSRYLDAIRPALAEDFLLKNPRERELTWKRQLSSIGQLNAMITRLPQGTPELYGRMSQLIYDSQLLAKGILLSSDIEFDKLLASYGTSQMKDSYARVRANLIEIDSLRTSRAPVDDILSLTRATEALQLSLAREAADKGVYTDFLKHTSSDVAEVLTADEAAVEFVTLDSGVISSDNLVAAIVITKEWPTGISVPIATVSQLSTMIDDRDKFDKEAYTAAIWSGIISAVGAKHTIYFAPDGVLNNVGIEYLPLDGKPLSESVNLVRLSSTRELCRPHPVTPLSLAALFGDIDYIEDALPVTDKSDLATRHYDGVSFANLDHTAREISAIDSILRSHADKPRTLPFTGAKAGKQEFLSQAQIPLNLIHIATHGMYLSADEASATDPMSRSILAFAGANLYDSYHDNPGIVTAAEIATMSLHDCDLAVLSACESGIGKLADDGVFGLQRGFKNAGVKTLLVSLNEVADRATADMMIVFYRHLSTPGTSKLQALRSAQAEIRNRYPADPTWASFILIDPFN